MRMAGRHKWPPLQEKDGIFEDLDNQRRLMERTSTKVPSDKDDNSPALVYIANVGMHDYSAAFEWTPLGKEGVRKVTSGDIDRKNPERLVWNVVNGLRKFRSHDYFVFSGSPIPFAIGLSYLFMRYDAVQVLYYLKNKNVYFPITYTRDMFDRAEGIDFPTESEVEDNESQEYPTFNLD